MVSKLYLQTDSSNCGWSDLLRKLQTFEPTDFTGINTIKQIVQKFYFIIKRYQESEESFHGNIFWKSSFLFDIIAIYYYTLVTVQTTTQSAVALDQSGYH